MASAATPIRGCGYKYGKPFAVYKEQGPNKKGMRHSQGRRGPFSALRLRRCSVLPLSSVASFVLFQRQSLDDASSWILAGWK